MSSVIMLKGENLREKVMEMWKKSKWFYVIMAAFLTIGCHQIATIPVFSNDNTPGNHPSVAVDREFKLKVDEVANLPQENLAIKFLRVEQDSRCPQGVQCFWPGQVKIAVSLVQDGEDLGEFILTKRPGQPDAAVFNANGYEFKLLKVNPYPQKNSKPDFADYLITLTVKPQ